jgi:hypothetical protein
VSRAWWRIVLTLVAAQAYAEVAPIPTDRRADAYAVYSAVLTRPSLNHPDTGSRYLIAGTTGIAQEGHPDACFDLPRAYASSVREILADAARFRDRAFRLERAFSIPKRYELLTPAEAASFMDPRRNPPDRALQERFAGATDLITLGNVYFNSSRTVAAVKMFAWCGRLCGQGTWRVLQKENGEWKDRDWVSCTRLALLNGR